MMGDTLKQSVGCWPGQDPDHYYSRQNDEDAWVARFPATLGFLVPSKQQGQLRAACYRFFGPIVYMFES